MKPVFSVGGTVQASGGVYIKRPADDELFQLCMEGSYAHVLTSRQMGKSSLRVAVAERLRAEGVRTAAVDLTAIGTQAESAEQWYVSVLEKVETDLRLRTPVLEWWEARGHLTPTDRFGRYLLEVALKETDGRVVIFVDEIDSTLSLPFSADDFFATVRYLYNARAELAEARRISFVLIGSVAPGDLIRDAVRTPFNIGRGVSLTDLREQDCGALAAGFGLPEARGRERLRRIFKWTGGHPYLTQRLCVEAARAGPDADVDGLVRGVFLAAGDRKDSNIEWVRDMLTEGAPEREALHAVWREVLIGERVADDEVSLAKSHLKLAGVVRVVDGTLQVRNPIYAMAFDERWILGDLYAAVVRERMQRRLSWLGATATVLTAAILLVARPTVSFLNKWDKAAQQEFGLRLATQAQRLYSSSGQLSVGALVGIEAARRVPTADSIEVIATALRLSRIPRERLDHDGTVTALAWGPDGKWLATGSEDHKARVWDVVTGRERVQIKHQERVTAVAISPNGKWVATAGADKTARIWDLVTGRERARLDHLGTVTAVVISPDSNWLATGSDDGTARIWDAVTGHMRALLHHQDRVRALAISPDGKSLATGSNDQTARIWDVVTGHELSRFEHHGFVTALAFSRDGKWLACGTWEGASPHIWDVAGGVERVQIDNHGWVYDVAVSPDGKWLISAGNDGAVRVRDAKTGYERALFKQEALVRAVAVSPDGKWIATASADKTARIWDASTGRELARLEHGASVNVIAISADGRWLATGSDDRTARIWDATNGSQRRQLEHTDQITTMAVSPGGRWIATATADSVARIWDVGSSEELASLQGAAVGSVAISSNGRFLAACSRGKTVDIWDVARGHLSAHLEHQSPVTAVAISPDGKWAASANADRFVRVWDTAKGQERARLEHDGLVTAVAISPDGASLVSASEDRTTRIWDPSTERQRARLVHQSAVTALAMSSDGRWLASSTSDNSVKVWEQATGKELTQIRQQNAITAIAISADGRWLAAADSGNSARIWETSTGRVLWRLKFEDPPKGLAFTADSKFLGVAHGHDVTWELWQAEDLISELCMRLPRNLTVAEWNQYLVTEAYRRTCPNIAGPEDSEGKVE